MTGWAEEDSFEPLLLTNKKLKLQSHDLVVNFQRFLQKRYDAFNLHDARIPEPEEEESNPSLCVHPDLFTLKSQKVHKYYPESSKRQRRNKYGITDLRSRFGDLAPTLPVSASSKCYAFQANTDKNQSLKEQVQLCLRSSTKNSKCTDIFTVCIDSGCTITITNCIDDFEEPPSKGDFGTMKTVDGVTKIQAFGIIRWTVPDVKGKTRVIRTPAFYIQSADQKLLSPQHYAKFHGWSSQDEDMCGINAARMWILLNNDQKEEARIEAPISTFDNLPYIVAQSYQTSISDTDDNSTTVTDVSAPCNECGTTCTCNQISTNFDAMYHMEVLSDSNENLTSAQKELLLDHQRLGHIHMAHLQDLYRPKTIKCEFDGCSKEADMCLISKHPTTSSCTRPQCLACHAAKAHRRSNEAKHSTMDKDHEGSLTTSRLQPGDQIHVDNYESSVRGRRTHTYGKERHHERYCGGTIFYDAASGLVKVYHQTSLDADSTLVSKRLFERDAAQCGVSVKNYHADNGIFTSAKWKDVLLDLEQYQTLSGSGAHHQNPLAERYIGVVCASARAMLMHLQIHWPDQYDTRLWPLALDYAAWLYNHTPKRNGLAPIEIFCGTRTGCDYLRRAKVFGAPCYVLDPKLTDSKGKIPKWSARSRRGQFLGFSQNHSTSVGLIRNLRTNSITPQYHYVIDQLFTTVPGGQSGRTMQELTEDELQIYLKNKWDTPDRVDSLENWDHRLDPELPELAPEWSPILDGSVLPDPDEGIRVPRLNTRNQQRLPSNSRRHSPPAPLPPQPPDDSAPRPRRLIFLDDDDQDSRPARSPEGGNANADTRVTFELGSDDDDDHIQLQNDDDDSDNEIQVTSQRPQRTRREPNRLTADSPGQLKDSKARLTQAKYKHLFRFNLPRLSFTPIRFTPQYTHNVARAMLINWNESFDWDDNNTKPIGRKFEALMEASTCPLTHEVFYVHPLALQIRLNQSKDQPTLNSNLADG